MKPQDIEFDERVVRMTETCDGEVIREFFCIYDRNYLHWMSREPFDEFIWTKAVACRQEFETREEAESTLQAFLLWRRGLGPNRCHVDDMPPEREAA